MQRGQQQDPRIKSYHRWLGLDSVQIIGHEDGSVTVNDSLGVYSQVSRNGEVFTDR